MVTRREINYFELGATMYCPIMNDSLKEIANFEKFKNLKSIVICLEDSTKEEDVEDGLKKLENLLTTLKTTELKIFIRPRNLKMLNTILKFDSIYKVDGFSIPKFDTSNINDYLSIFRQHNDFYIMPILETNDVFDIQKLNEIALQLKPFGERILSVRVGSEDILSLLSMRRDSNLSIYDYMPFHSVYTNIINIFKPMGFNLSAPVSNTFKNKDMLNIELAREIAYGIFNKTIIHPSQIDDIQEAYKITEIEDTASQRILGGKEEVFSLDGSMYERKPHTPWAKGVRQRKEEYGIKGK